MKGNMFFKTISFNIIIIFLTSIFFLNNAFSAGTILYVSDGTTDPPNWDIYKMNSDGTGVQRLTDSPSIDNHPDLSPDGTTVAFSSDLTGNFEIYKAPLATLSDEGTWTQLTTAGITGGVEFGCNSSINPSRCTPARHPHWSPDGSHIIYTANDGCCCSSEPVVSHCSVPVKILDPCCTDSGKETEHYERIHIMDSDGKNDIPIDLIQLGLELGPSTCDAPQIFHGGHPGFNPAGDKIIFTGATNRDGTVWDVFVTGWNGTDASGLVKITEGTSYPPSLNPISMSGGATFANEGNDILFSSTRTPKGNSQLFLLEDWATQPLPVPPGDDIRQTFHCGNDYVPHELHNMGGPEMIVYNSDAVPPGQPWDNPTDQEIFIMNSDGSGRTNLTNTPSQSEVLLLADEVSWFCGLPRNLSPCHFIPRIYSLESFYLMLYADPVLPPTFTNRELYAIYTAALFNWKQTHKPDYLTQINNMLNQYLGNPNCLSGSGSCPEALPNLALPTFMPDTDAWCPGCVECDDCLLIIVTPTIVSPEYPTADLQGGNVGDPYSQTFTVNGGSLPISWQVFAGQLPPGLSLNQNTGEISGTPTQPGTFAFSIAASDTNGNADSLDDTISVTGLTDITANDSDVPITLGSTDTLSVKVSLAAGGSSGTPADWWVAADTPFGWFYYNLSTSSFVFAGASPFDILVTFQGPLFNLSPPFEVLNMPIPSGTYTFYFAVDWIVNGVLDLGSMDFDSVKVVVP